MLRKIRIALAALVLAGITLLLIGIGHEWWGWMAKLQFLPSCLALNFGVIALITILTLILGRLYCSVICPMGIFQDVVIWLRRRIGLGLQKSQANKMKKAKAEGKEVGKPKQWVKRFAYSPEHKWVRYAVLALLVVAICAGLQVIVAILAPYSAYGRMVRSFVGIAEGNAFAAGVVSVTIVGLLTCIAIFLCAWFWGRAYCNTVCPVGTVLSLFSRFAMFRPTIDTSKCIGCAKCEKACKASCISSFSHSIDYSRCVDCFDCIDNCQEGAIKYRFAWGKKDSAPAKASPAKEEAVDTGRRTFAASAALLLGGAALKAQEMKVDGGFADVIDKQIPSRSERLVPFGSGSVKNFYDHCTACQLCVSACPNGVLRPSGDLEHLLQPQMGYEKGYCRPECTECSQVCPAGAILPVQPAEKFTIHIGTASVNYDLCFAANGEADCGNCSRHCPVGAIRMVDNDKYGHKIPVVVEDQCIGCGACEFLCPSRPISAITVSGLSVHRNNN